MTKGLPSGGGTHPGTIRRIASDYFVICSRFATVPLYIPVVHGKSTTIIDAGISDTPSQAIEPALLAEGLKPSSVHQLALTHGHHDHFGGLAELKQMAPDVIVQAHRADIAWIEDNDRYWRELFERFEADLPLDPAERTLVGEQSGHRTLVDQILEPGDRVETEGASALVAIDAYGSHSAGSLAYYNERSSILVTGDVLQASGTPFADGSAAFPIYEDIAKYILAVRAFRDLSPEVLVDAHRGVLEGDAIKRLLDDCLAFPDRLTNQLAEALGAAKKPQSLVEVAHELQDRLYPEANRTIQLYQTVALHLQDLVKQGVAVVELVDDRKSWVVDDE